MPTSTSSDLVQSPLYAHVATKGTELYAAYGPHLGWPELQRILDDRRFTRFPCQVAFSDLPLEPGEFAHLVRRGPTAENGAVLYVHPFLASHPTWLPYVVLHQLVFLNYGALASSDDAEIFGATALGVSQETYYHSLCEICDLINDGLAMEPLPFRAERHGCLGNCTSACPKTCS